MGITNGGAVRSVQKLQTIIPSQVWPVGSTIKTFPLTGGNFSITDPTNTVMQNVWWRIASGAVGQPIVVCADIQAVGAVTVVVNNMGAAPFTASLELGGTVLEYAGQP